MELSAGPSYWTNELPVQVASQLRGISNSTYYGKLWMSKFIGAYVNGAVNNLFAPDQLYPVNYAQSYNIQLYVIDNRTSAEQVQGPRLEATINQSLIQESLASLVPFVGATGVTVNIRYADVRDYPGLAAIMANATTTLTDPISGRPIVDGDLVYNWFTTYGLGHIANFINVTRTTSRIDIPGLLFAFKGNYTFGVPFKEDIGSPSLYGTFGGEALGDMVLIGFSQQADFTIGNNSTYSQPGKGAGFTHAAAHQLANSDISPALVFSLIGVAIGVAIGILLGYLIFRRRKSAGVQYNRCPTCQQLLRWDPAQMRWYCDTCQKPV